MRTAPARSRSVQIVTILAAFLAGPIAAFRLSPVLSPESGLVAAIAPFSFGLVLFFGIFFWVGLGVIKVLFGGLGRMARGGGPRQSVHPDERLVPPGYGAFPVLGGLVGAGLGVAGTVLSDAPFLTSFGGWLGLGLAYGTALWFAAHDGYLPFPDDD